jgi:hypothetical protein
MRFIGSKLEKFLCGIWGHEYYEWDDKKGNIDSKICRWCEIKRPKSTGIE